MYSVDGQAQNSDPVSQTSYTIGGLERGSHTITVALIGPKGEQAAAGSVTVHMKPPIAQSPPP